jgi:RNA recognition motif-containing protein
MSSTLYVANLSASVERDEVERLFAVHGTVRSINLIPQSQSANGTRAAFVEMDSAEHAAAAIETLDGSPLRGGALYVGWAAGTRVEVPGPTPMFESMNVPGEDEDPETPGAGRRDCSPMQP